MNAAQIKVSLYVVWILADYFGHTMNEVLKICSAVRFFYGFIDFFIGRTTIARL
jgi:hypothetical protein